ncbi:D-alanyl-D-alanine carboxypeptidase/D-alanyl-D-alanine-endopeptidase [bacterium]|nr:D-alanyl-D-alanine carboxypeptidase/D-alanyl-D-alanine-endopeptidase [bacterium]
MYQLVISRAVVHWASPCAAFLFSALFMIGTLGCQRAVLAADPRASLLPEKVSPSIPKLRAFSKLQVPEHASVVVFDVHSGETLFHARARSPRKPASVLKVLIAAVALEELTPYHTFETEIRGTGLAKTRVEKLYLKGGGDPSLTQEDLWKIARKVALRGVRSIGQIVVDESAFADPKPREGQRSYQAGTSALSLNYNSITFEVCPVAGQNKALVAHDPSEYPITYRGAITVSSQKSSSYRVDEEQASVPGSYLLGGVLNRRAGCQQVHRSVPDPALYAGHVLKGLLRKEGIVTSGGVSHGVAPQHAAVIYTHRSQPLRHTIQLLNTYSNNMIADQLLTLLGPTPEGRFSRSAGRKRVEHYLKKRGVSLEGIVLEDGSGLSHKNRVSAEALRVALEGALTSDDFGVEFIASLPVDGKSGTLRKRSYPGITRAKTGTINGVMSLAGRIKNQRGRELAFVILQNKVTSRERGNRFEKAVLQLLHRSSL